MVADPRIRASDDDRDRTASLLREHHAVGRLTPEEFNERLDKAFAARTIGDLDELLADLPGIDLYRLPGAGLPNRIAGGSASRMDAMAAAGQVSRWSPGWRAAWGSWLSMTLVLVGIWALAGMGYPWFAWIIGPWGLGLLGRWIAGAQHPDEDHRGHGHLHDGPDGPGGHGQLPGDPDQIGGPR